MAKAYCKEKKDEDKDKRPNEGPLAFLGLHPKSVDHEEKGEDGQGEENANKCEDVETEKEEKKGGGEDDKEEGKNDDEKMEGETETEKDESEEKGGDEAMEVEEANEEAASSQQTEEQQAKVGNEEAEKVDEGIAQSQIQVDKV